MKTHIKERDIVLVIIFSLVTCGIYNVVLYFIFGAELHRESIAKNTATRVEHPGLALLLGIITCGIYTIYYYYKQAELLKELGDRHRAETVDPVIVLLLTIFVGIGIYLNVYSGNNVAKVMNNGVENQGFTNF